MRCLVGIAGRRPVPYPCGKAPQVTDSQLLRQSPAPVSLHRPVSSGKCGRRGRQQVLPSGSALLSPLRLCECSFSPEHISRLAPCLSQAQQLTELW